jgi:hypothetical protein
LTQNTVCMYVYSIVHTYYAVHTVHTLVCNVSILYTKCASIVAYAMPFLMIIIPLPGSRTPMTTGAVVVILGSLGAPNGMWR